MSQGERCAFGSSSGPHCRRVGRFRLRWSKGFGGRRRGCYLLRWCADHLPHDPRDCDDLKPHLGHIWRAIKGHPTWGRCTCGWPNPTLRAHIVGREFHYRHVAEEKKKKEAA